MYPQEHFAYHKRPFGLYFASKGLGYLAALLLLLLLVAPYKLSCYQTTLLLTILALADINLLKTTCHFLLLLVGFDTLTYRKELQLIPYTCGSSAPKECHLKDVKRIVRYLIHTPNFGIWYRGLLLILLAILTRTMPETRLIESPLRVLVNFLVDLLCLGPPRNKTRYAYLPPKRSTLPLVHVVLNYFG